MKKSGFVNLNTLQLTKTVNGIKYDLKSLMSTVTRLTKTIGQYKKYEDSDSAYIVEELRKFRQKAVNKIKTHFGVRWKVKDGRSIFYGA
jgi:archaellum component FlaC